MNWMHFHKLRCTKWKFKSVFCFVIFGSLALLWLRVSVSYILLHPAYKILWRAVYKTENGTHILCLIEIWGVQEYYIHIYKWIQFTTINIVCMLSLFYSIYYERNDVNWSGSHRHTDGITYLWHQSYANWHPLIG